jgi:two-component system, sensor histidine kinase RpfC
MRTVQRLISLWRNARRHGGDEFEQGLFRILFTGALFVYLLADSFRLDWPAEQAPALTITVFYLLTSLAILAAVRRSPRLSHVRHTITMVADVSAITAAMYLAGPKGSVLYVIFLWLSIGNGFRYGLPYMFLCVALSLVGFGTLLITSSYWGMHSTLGVGLLIGLAALPLFSSLLVHRLNRALRHAEEVSQAKSQFVANMSHELRTPLNGVVGMGYLLMNTPLSPVAREYVSTILASSRTLLSLIDNILDLSKIEAGRVEIESVEFDLYALLHSIVAMFSAQASQKGLRLMLHIDPATPPALAGSVAHLRQVLVNLIGNAVKFTERGFVDVRAAPCNREDATTALRFEVVDTGIGIPENALGRIFDSFTQADASTTRRFGGTGLGTTIAKQLTELMGGTIAVASAVGKGTTFSVEIPLVVTSPPTRGSRLVVRVLLVSAAVQDGALQAALSAAGTEATTCATAAQAFAELVNAARNTRPYHVVFFQGATDADASAFVSTVNHEPLLATLTVVLLRAPDADSPVRQSLEAGYAYVFEGRVGADALDNVLRFACAHDNHAQDRAAPQSDWAGAARGRKLRILVAEDNATNQLVIRRILDTVGHDVVVVGDGEEAVEALGNDTFDLAIVDMHMPKMNGVDVIKYAKWTLPDGRWIPFIVLTADATKDALEECMAAGASTFVTKPVDPAKLLQQIEKLLPTKPGETPPERAARALPLRRAASDLLDTGPLDELLSLGSLDTTVTPVIDVFQQDAQMLLGELSDDLTAGRLRDLREHLHALKGCAASIGAAQLRALALSAEKLDDRTLTARGSSVVAELKSAYDATRSALSVYAQTLITEAAHRSGRGSAPPSDEP